MFRPIKHLDLIDLNVRPRGIVPIWVLLSAIVLGFKLFGAPISWILVAVIPGIGMGLLNLFIGYAILEAIQKDFIYVWNKMFRDKYAEDHEERCESCGQVIYEEEE